MKGLMLVGRGNESLAYGPTVQRMLQERPYPQPMLYDVPFIMERVYHGDWQLWFLVEDDQPQMMILTYVNAYPAGKQCYIEMVVGEGLLDLTKLGAVFDAWCKEEGIVLTTATPLEAIARIAMKQGWQSGHRLIYKWMETQQ